MKFITKENNLKKLGVINYSKDDQSFIFDPPQPISYSILIGYVELSFDWNKKARQVIGFSPYNSWIFTSLSKPKIDVVGDLILKDCFDEITRIDNIAPWKTYFDKFTGWICIGKNLLNINDKCIEFSKNILAVLNSNDTLEALWLKPIIK